ncbi:MAG: hypothetical protein U1E50_03130 [Caulobacteraceae bacterium]
MIASRIWGGCLVLAVLLGISPPASAGTMIGAWEIGEYTRPDGSKSAVARSTGPAMEIEGESVDPQLIVECQAAPNPFGRVYVMLEKRPPGTVPVTGDDIPVSFAFTPGAALDLAFRPLAARSAVQNWAALPPFIRSAVNTRLVTVQVRDRAVTFDTAGLSEALRYLDQICTPAAGGAPPQAAAGMFEGAWYMSVERDYERVLVQNAVLFADATAAPDQRTSLELICAPGRRAEMIWALPRREAFTLEGDVSVSFDGGAPIRVNGWRDQLSRDFTSYPDQPFSGLAPQLRNARTATFRWRDVSATFELRGIADVLRRLSVACELNLAAPSQPA